MRWYDKIFYGVKAGKQCKTIVKKLRKKKDLKDIYIVTIADNDNNLLDMYDAINFFRQHKKKSYKNIIGVAIGREEAYDLIGGVVKLVYNETGSFDIKKYMSSRGL